MRFCNTQQKLLSLRDGKRKLSNIMQLAELLEQISLHHNLGPHALACWLARMRNVPEARQSIPEQSHQIRLETDQQAVNLLTIHMEQGPGVSYRNLSTPLGWHTPQPPRDQVGQVS